MHACHRPAPVHRCLRGRQALTIRPTGLAVDARCGHPALRVACIAGELSQKSTTMIVPANAHDAAGMVSQALAVFGTMQKAGVLDVGGGGGGMQQQQPPPAPPPLALQGAAAAADADNDRDGGDVDDDAAAAVGGVLEQDVAADGAAVEEEQALPSLPQKARVPKAPQRSPE
eukprot:COSAG01_NODE_6718_length_3530_cov_5.092101_4_plen_172_part_00